MTHWAAAMRCRHGPLLNQMYCQVQPAGRWSPQWSQGANVVPAFTWSRVPGYCVHSTVPSLGTVSPGL